MNIQNFLSGLGLFRSTSAYSESKLLNISTIFPDLNSSKKNWTEAKLVNDLLTDYNPWARPRVNPREIVNVWLFMYLFLLNDVVSFY